MHRSPPHAPRGPHVPLYDHVYARPRMSTQHHKYTYVFRVPPAHNVDPTPPAATRVPLSGHAYGSETACHNRTARTSPTHTATIGNTLTARCDLPRPPCVTLRAPRAETMGQQAARPRPRVPPSHYRLRVTRMQICAPPRTPSASHWWQMHPACAPLGDPSAPASRSRLRARAQV